MSIISFKPLLKFDSVVNNFFILYSMCLKIEQYNYFIMGFINFVHSSSHC